MSLIHQALKKLEDVKHGHASSIGYTSVTGRRTRGLKVLLPVFLVFILTGIAVFVYHPGLVMPGHTAKGPVSAPAPARDLNARAAAFTSKGPVDTMAAALEHNKRGVSLYKSGEIREAAVEFRAAIDNDPERSDFYNNLGLAYAVLDDPDQAEKHFKEALKKRPGFPAALNNYGAFLAEGGELARALNLLNKAIALDPEFRDPHLNLAVSLERIGRLSEAIVHYERYLELLSPGTPYEDTVEIRRRVRALRGGLFSVADMAKRSGAPGEDVTIQDH
jgi:tetratricopeptide (TPR) repeat protein